MATCRDSSESHPCFVDGVLRIYDSCPEPMVHVMAVTITQSIRSIDAARLSTYTILPPPQRRLICRVRSWLVYDQHVKRFQGSPPCCPTGIWGGTQLFLRLRDHHVCLPFGCDTAFLLGYTAPSILRSFSTAWEIGRSRAQDHCVGLQIY